MTRKTEGLSDTARKVLDAMIEAFREIMEVDMSPEDFRLAALELLDGDLAIIVQRGDEFAFTLTPEGYAMLGLPESIRHD